MRREIPSVGIPEILEVGRDKLTNMAELICKTGIERIVVFYGIGIKEMFGTVFLNSFQASMQTKILKEYEFDDIRMEALMQEAFSLPGGTQAIVGLGGGKVLDVAKYIAFLNNLFFVSIPTSTAHDGFASAGCSLLINGKRTSVQARMPYGIIVDTGIIQNSPHKFIYSGLGDMVSKITAVYDWQFEEKHGKTRVNDFAVMMAKKSVNSMVRMPYTSISEEFFIKELVDSLTMSGIAMAIAGNSSPASGSEHLISHALDKILDTPQLHGIQVGIATYVMALVQKHRVKRIAQFLSDTGFFAYVETLDLKRADFQAAIDLAPTIKPNRYTYVHVPEYREQAKAFLAEDAILQRILK